MKKAAPLIIVGLLLLPTITFAEAHQHDNKSNDEMKGGMMMGMMNPEQLKTMHEHMQKMQSMMENIKQQEDPNKRVRMLEQHSQMMQHTAEEQKQHQH